VAPPSGAFSNSDLNGTYVFSSTGSDFSNGFLAVAGAFTADGNGGITGGTMDVVGVDVNAQTTVAQPITAGAYSVSVDGRGQVQVTTSVGTIGLDFVLASSSHGLVTEFDNTGSGSGTLDRQTAVTDLAQLTGTYAFSLSGSDASGNPIGTAGAVTLDGSGNVTAGVQDVNDDGFDFPNLTLTSPAAVALGSGTAPGSISLTTTFGALTFDFYPIDATHLKFIETDSLPIIAGDAFSQGGASVPTGNMVFTVAGLDNNGPVAAGGLVTTTGTTLTGLEDVNDGGNVSPGQLSFSGTYALNGLAVGNRTVLNLTSFIPGTQFVLYPSTGGVLMLEIDQSALTAGTAFAQSSTALSTPDGYGLNLTGFDLNSGFEADDIAEFTAQNGDITGIADINDGGGFPNQSLGSNSTYTPDSPATGRGLLTATNQFNLQYYIVDSNTAVFVELDSSQPGVGTIALQSSAAPPPGAMQHPIAITRPMFRSHAVLHHSK
jgi:hypothetical protein